MAGRVGAALVIDGDREVLEAPDFQLDGIADQRLACQDGRAGLAAEGDRAVRPRLRHAVGRRERYVYGIELQRTETELVGEADAHAITGRLELHDLADRLVAESADLIAAPDRGRRKRRRVPGGYPMAIGRKR